jgi:hypothetical protein
VGANSPVLKDYALISRIRNSETGHVVVVIGGLYTYGTEAAGEFLTDPQLIQAIGKTARPDSTHQNLQIVLETTVTDETPRSAKGCCGVGRVIFPSVKRLFSAAFL